MTTHKQGNQQIIHIMPMPQLITHTHIYINILFAIINVRGVGNRIVCEKIVQGL